MVVLVVVVVWGGIGVVCGGVSGGGVSGGGVSGGVCWWWC